MKILDAPYVYLCKSSAQGLTHKLFLIVPVDRPKKTMQQEKERDEDDPDDTNMRIRILEFKTSATDDPNPPILYHFASYISLNLATQPPHKPYSKIKIIINTSHYTTILIDDFLDNDVPVSDNFFAYECPHGFLHYKTVQHGKQYYPDILIPYSNYSKYNDDTIKTKQSDTYFEGSIQMKGPKPNSKDIEYPTNSNKHWYKGDDYGSMVFETLLNSGAKRKVKIRNKNANSMPNP